MLRFVGMHRTSSLVGRRGYKGRDAWDGGTTGEAQHANATKLTRDALGTLVGRGEHGSSTEVMPIAFVSIGL